MSNISSPPCFYCKKPTRYVQDEMTRSNSWQCDWHGAVRVQHNPPLIGGPHTVTLVVLYKEQTYHATFFYNFDASASVSKFHLTKINRRPRTDRIILTLDFYPDITPENVASKLPTYIMFS